MQWICRPFEEQFDRRLDLIDRASIDPWSTVITYRQQTLNALENENRYKPSTHVDLLCTVSALNFRGPRAKNSKDLVVSYE